MLIEDGGYIFLCGLGSADVFALGGGVRHSRPDARPQDGEFQLGEHGGNLDKGLAHWVNLSVSAIHRDTAEDDKAHSLFLDNADDFEELLGASAQPADLGGDDGIARFGGLKQQIQMLK